MNPSDIVWFGRAGVWIGSALLIAMAVTGAQVGTVSIIAVVGIVIGAAFLLYAIPFREDRRN
jgi:hypothetical protein